MKYFRVLFLILVALLPLRADDTVSFDYFYDSLLPYGEWSEVDGYGYVWHPTGVDEGWAPYTDGYWAYTDAGWTWVSYEDWGAITYHYGRWTEIDDYGWCWVPGYEWGPAWVAWRKSEDYVGWAPLPPEATWERDTGISTWVDVSYDIGPTYYNFCRWNDFGAPVIRSVILPRWNSITIIESTTNITNITYNTDYGCVYNGGFDYGYVTPRVYRPLPTLVLVQNTTNIFINGNNNNVYINARRGNTLVVSTPRKVAVNPTIITKRPVNARKFQAAKVNRGWKGIKDPAVRDRLVVKLRDESKGSSPKTAPAKPFKAEQVAVVPKTADPNAKVEDAPLGRPQKNPDGNKKQNVADQPPSDVIAQPGVNEQKGNKGDKDKPGQTAPVATAPVNPVAEEKKTNNPPAQAEVMPGEDETVAQENGRKNKQDKPRSNLVAPHEKRNDKEPKPQRETVPPENVVGEPAESRSPVNQPLQVSPENQNQKQEQRQAEAEQRRMQNQQKQAQTQQEAAEAAQRKQAQETVRENAQRQQQQENAARQQQAEMRKQQQEAAKAQQQQEKLGEMRKQQQEAANNQQRQQQQEAARQQQQQEKLESMRKQQQEAANNQQRQQQQEAARQQQQQQKQESIRKQQQEAANDQQRQQQQEAARQQRQQQEAAREQAGRQQQAERAAAQAEARQRQQEVQQQRAAQAAEARERAQSAAAENARRSQEMQQRQATQAQAAQRAAQESQRQQSQSQQPVPSSGKKRSGKNREEEY